MRYTVGNVKGNPSAYGKLSADLLEDGIAIAKVTRGAQVGGFIDDLKFKFYTDASKNRFEDWCDSISMSEGFEALLSPKSNKGKKA
jgi:hypothetical protein